MRSQAQRLQNVGVAARYRGIVTSTIQAIGSELRAARHRSTLTMKEAAAAAGRTYQWLDNLEAGRRERVLLSDIDSVARAYGLRLWVKLAPDAPGEPVFLSAAVAHIAGQLTGLAPERLRRISALVRAATRADDQHLAAATVFLGGTEADEALPAHVGASL